MAVPIRSPSEIEAIGRAGRALRIALDAAIAACRAGATTGQIDRLIERLIGNAGAEPILRGHRLQGSTPFPACSSICVNEEVGAGIPGERIIRGGDIVSVDIALSLDGWCADASRCLAIEPARPERVRLAAAARAVVAGAAALMHAGRRWSAVAEAARAEADRLGFRVMPGFGGHGVGRDLHEPPAALFNEPAASGRGGAVGQDFVLRPGMVLTIEPILLAPGPDTPPGVVEAGDGWTLLTSDRSDAAHEEWTVAVTRRGPIMLTGPVGG